MGGIKIFRRDFFVSKCRKNFVGEPCSLSLISGIEEFYASEVMSQFPSKVFCLTVPKHFVEEPFYAVFQKISGSEKFYGQEGGGSIKSSFENFLSHSAENFRRANL